MYRDFTYIDDLVQGIKLLINTAPKVDENKTNSSKDIPKSDSHSPVAPFRIVNIGNSKKVKLLDFIEVIENIMQKKAIRNYMPMQKGDVPATWADSSLLKNLTGFVPKTHYKDGIENFIKWYSSYYQI